MRLPGRVYSSSGMGSPAASDGGLVPYPVTRASAQGELTGGVSVGVPTLA